MKHAGSLKEIEEAIVTREMVLFMFTGSSCGVCQAVKPKIKELLRKLPQITGVEVNLDEIPEASGKFQLFAVPSVVFFIEGKEYLRKLRYFGIQEIEEQIIRYVEVFNE